jgi:hypothetical protein
LNGWRSERREDEFSLDEAGRGWNESATMPALPGPLRIVDAFPGGSTHLPSFAPFRFRCGGWLNVGRQATYPAI